MVPPVSSLVKISDVEQERRGQNCVSVSCEMSELDDL